MDFKVSSGAFSTKRITPLVFRYCLISCLIGIIVLLVFLGQVAATDAQANHTGTGNLADGLDSRLVYLNSTELIHQRIAAMPAPVLSPDELKSALNELQGWGVKDGKLHRQFQFPSFVEAFGFMASLAVFAEATGNHPEWFNVYNRVVIDMTTHDSGGITLKDIEFAKKANQLAR